MSISIAQQKDGAATASSLGITLNNATVNGNGIVVSIGSTGAISSVTDDQSNTYTQRRTANFFGGTYSYIFDCVNISNNPTTITVHPTSGSPTMTARVYEVNGTLTAHAGSSNSGNTTAIAPGAISTTTADTIWFLAVHTSSSGGYTQPSGWTLDTNANGDQFSSRVFTTTQTSVNPTGSNNSGGASASLEAYTSTNTGSVVYNKSVSSTLTFTEAQTPGHVAPLSVTSTLTLTETQTYIDAFAPHVTSTLTLTETQTTVNVLNLSVSQTLTLTEIVSTTHMAILPVSQSLTLAETQLPVGIITRTVPQTLTFTETQTTENVLNPTLSQGLNFGTSRTTANVLNLEVDQTLTFTDHIAKAISLDVTSTLTFVQVTPIPVKQTFWFIDNSISQKTPIASSGSNGGTLVLTFPATTSLNNGIVVVVGNQSSGGTTITSITDDSTGNTYSLLQDSSNLGTPRTRIYYVSAAKALNSITLHFSTTGNQVAAIAYEISGTITPDAGNTNWENNSTQTTGSISTATSTLVFAADTTGGTLTEPSSWVSDGQAQGVHFIHNIYSSSQTVNPAWISGGSNRYAAAIESFTTANRGGIHQSLTFTETVAAEHVSNPFISQTLNLTQPNRIPLTYSLVRTVAQTLNLTETATGVASKHTENTLTFTQDQTAELIKTVSHHLEFGGFASAQLVSNVTCISLFQPFQTIASGPNILHLAVSSSLTLASSASGYDTKPVSQTLTFSQVVIGVASKAVVEHLSLSQTIRVNKSVQVSASNRLQPFQIIAKNQSKAVQVHHFFGFNGFQKTNRVYSESISQTLALIELATRERHSESVSQTLTLLQTLAGGRLATRSVQSSLVLTQTVRGNISASVNVSNSLTFLATHNRYMQDQIFQVPNVQAYLNEPYTYLRGPNKIVVLPNPQFGDGQGNTGEFTLRFSINGRSYTYVKNNNTTKLNYTFWLSRRKCRELQAFLQLYQAQLVELQNWKGEIWKVYITNNPFDTTSVSMYTNGRPTNEERWDISLEFEGIKVN